MDTIKKNCTKKIAYIGIKGLPAKAGADRVVEAIVDHLDQDSFEPTVYCSAREVEQGNRREGVKIVRIPEVPGKYLGAPLLFLLSALHAVLFGKYDLVHIHNVEACFILPILRLRYQVISTSHGSAYFRDKWSRWAKKLIRLTEIPYIRLSNVVTCVSKPLSQQYESDYGRTVEYLPNGIQLVEDIDADKAREILKEHKLEEGKYMLFAAGRIIPTKGCHHLIDALKQLDDDIHLLVVGDASHLPRYQAELLANGDPRVHFHTFVADKSVLMGLLKMARIFVFPSMYEAMSMMLLETASIKTPVICSNIPENVVVLPEEALIFESENVSDLVAKLRWALDNPKVMQDLADSAYQRVSRLYQWGTIVRQYQILYHDMISQREINTGHSLAYEEKTTIPESE